MQPAGSVVEISSFVYLFFYCIVVKHILVLYSMYVITTGNRILRLTFSSSVLSGVFCKRVYSSFEYQEPTFATSRDNCSREVMPTMRKVLEESRKSFEDWVRQEMGAAPPPER